MYTPGPSAKELEAFGLLIEDVVTDEVVEVWPENWLALQVFSMVRTQWRVAMGGPTGLDYAPLPFVFDTLNVGKKKRLDTLWAVQQLEAAALNVMSEANKG